MDLQDKLAALVVSVAGDVKALLMALANKQDKLNSGTSIKTINGASVLGEGDLVIEGGGGGGGGLTLFEESRSVATPNATVPVHALTALGAETNIDFVIAPKGAGAFSLQVPDNTTAGGNKRGAGAVDLQTSRNSAIQVASGQDSFLAGAYCRASGNRAAAAGYQASATGPDSFATGSLTVADAQYGFSSGSYTTTRTTIGAQAWGNAAALGRQQLRRIPLRIDTTSTTAEVLNTSGSSTPGSNQVVALPNNSAYYCRLRVLARNTATNESMSWSGTALIKRGANAASTTLIGSTIASDFGDASMSACTVTLSADTTLGCLAVTVTGLASTTIRWVAQLETVEAA